MLLSRRACYKCGNIGHYAGWSPQSRTINLPDFANGPIEVCSSSERLCYNCKQPGKVPCVLLS
ncbi:hypothetical protein BDV36DRAFT_258215 [Aspergillus pseudocaelatus]|uniref:CCHC-type domain-containing protein n=1 Tax=Aspergillus pseudocaelatus TaxID=1825620 RepID=A0ABQ6WIZ4_9EURO|nr:hypothetical protein BDV36DRAFT_258215 [Aspergillus pseudocaelatus]